MNSSGLLTCKGVLLAEGKQCDRQSENRWAGWIQVQWPTTIRRMDRFEHVRVDKYYSLTLGGKLL